MKHKIAALMMTAALICTACARQTDFPAGEWVDLTYDFSEQTNYWTETDNFKKQTVSEGRNPNGYYYSAYSFCAPEHGGTHLDAPVHFAEGRRPVEQIPLDQLIGPAVKINVSAKADADRDYLVSIADLTEWEGRFGQIPAASIVLLQTGFGRYWSDRSKYMGTAGEEKHFPGLSPEAARWLIDNRRIKAVGIDTASIDRGQSQNFETHVALMEQEVPAFENVANLEKLPPVGSTVFALPMKIKGGSGAPLRIVALLRK